MQTVLDEREEKEIDPKELVLYHLKLLKSFEDMLIKGKYLGKTQRIIAKDLSNLVDAMANDLSDIDFISENDAKSIRRYRVHLETKRREIEKDKINEG